MHFFQIGYHWQMDSRSQEGQESAGQHRDAQGKPHFSLYLCQFYFCESNVQNEHFQLMTSSSHCHATHSIMYFKKSRRKIFRMACVCVYILLSAVIVPTGSQYVHFTKANFSRQLESITLQARAMNIFRHIEVMSKWPRAMPRDKINRSFFTLFSQK